ncbi:MAG: BcpO-related WXXGXW repeat protein [bacterium]|nr:BcpO-related WXXGXW repeat protein [bacterium]
MKHRARLSLLTLILVAMLSGCATAVYVPNPPPACKVERKGPRPGARHVWVDGHWKYNGHRYIWVSGHWVKKKKSGVWVSGHWVQKPRGWVWVPGHWR